MIKCKKCYKQKDSSEYRTIRSGRKSAICHNCRVKPKEPKNESKNYADYYLPQLKARMSEDVFRKYYS